MRRILLHLDHPENRRLLAEWLSTQYQVLLPASPLALDEPFDLCILDGSALNRLWQRVQARKEQEQPLLLPFLLVTPKRDARLATGHLWQTVDELITTPIEKAELDARLQVLLRARQLSLELKVSNDARERRLAQFDALTDLPNRGLARERLDHALAQARLAQRMVALLFLDLDRFKVVNESFGHTYGDLLLQDVAQRLTDCVRRDETVARLGGDEFAVILPLQAWVSGAALAARSILAALSRPFRLLGREVYCGASIGIALYPLDAGDAEGLLSNAETAMYRAKQQGGNGYQFYAEAMQAQVLERLALETALRRALDRQEFVLHYQPKVSIASGAVTGVEALLRLPHPELGLISASRFIPVAEETGLIAPLGEWILRTACAQSRAWQAAHAWRVAVNLSPRQFGQRVWDLVEGVLREARFDPSHLELEITEGCLMQDAEGATRALDRLRALGIDVSIDDFGTGYSSMSYLKRFPVSALKIDQSFVRDLETDADSQSIVSAIINLAHSLKLTVVAEGVETAQQLARLRERGCEEAQGFYFGRPMPAEALTSLPPVLAPVH